MIEDPNGILSLIQEYLFYEPLLIPGIILAVFGVAGQWTLDTKCDLNGSRSVIPVLNVLEFMKIMGRPMWQGLIVMLPPLVILYALLTEPIGMGTIYIVAGALMLVWTLFMMRLYIELCQSFGKLSTTSYFLCILFNGFYVLYLGISSETLYYGPVYKKSMDEIKAHIAEVDAEED